MIATLSTTSLRMSPSMDRSFSRNSNTAGAPLPLIPRRSSAVRMNSATPPSTPKIPMPSKATLAQPTSPDNSTPTLSNVFVDDSDTSSSSPSDDSSWPTMAVRTKRVRGVRMPAVCPPEQSTPTPASFQAKSDLAKRRQQSHITVTGPPYGADIGSITSPPVARSVSANTPLIYTPGLSLRLNLDSAHTRRASDSFVDLSKATGSQPVKSAPVVEIPPAIEARLVRKKSGQPVKSSLKSSKPNHRGSLSVVTFGSSSKSEPNTPTHTKAVHFDAHLEHVKLFLAEQKPLAVSRDGSPTEDTSGTDTDFPSFIYGDTRERKVTKNLVMQTTNMPSLINPNADVALEELKLSADSSNIVGTVRVRNLDFQKWLAVRFTFDSWQTTSEVTAKYMESFDNGGFDRFGFTIRLQDMLARIDGKTLLLALRYTVQGREIWDNNGGRDYLAYFTKVDAKTESDEERLSGGDVADLRSKLEEVVQGKHAFLTQHSRRSVGVVEPEPPSPPVFKTSASLASRYDFGTSLRNPWKPSPTPLPRHTRMKSYPTTSSSIPFPEKNTEAMFSPPGAAPTASPRVGSPRDLGDHIFPSSPYTASEVEDLPFPVSGRNHQRGYFDIAVSETSGVRKTPPGTPRLRSFEDLTPSGSSPGRSYSFPPIDTGRSHGLGYGLTPKVGIIQSEEISGSELSTPSIMSPSSSSRSSTPSPSDAFMISPLTHEEDPQMSPNTNYHQFLNK